MSWTLFSWVCVHGSCQVGSDKQAVGKIFPSHKQGLSFHTNTGFLVENLFISKRKAQKGNGKRISCQDSEVRERII